MNVLVACEESQIVCTAFRECGHNAFSCDIQPCSGGHPEWHIQGDVLKVLNPNFRKTHIPGLRIPSIRYKTMDGTAHTMDGRWDLIIAHPPCTYMSNAGACRMFPKKGQIDPDRFAKAMEAKKFFLEFYNADCERICIENPVPLRCVELPEKTQVIQPYEYGHPYTKKTYLWLKALPNLTPTDIMEPVGPYVCGNSEIWKKQAAKGVVYGKEKSSVHRSKTFPGIARAMAEQWG
jgi:hypothetical protein